MASTDTLWGALNPLYVTWIRARGGDVLAKLKALINQAAGEGWTVNRLIRQVEALPSFSNGRWQIDAPEEGVPEEEVPEEELPPEDELPDLPGWEEDFYDGADVRATLTEFLRKWGLESMAGFVEQAISNKMSAAEIMIRLREHPAYLAAFPENGLRKENGLSWWSEGQILEYRDSARRLLQQYFGIGDATNTEIAGLVAQDVSLPEWENRLKTFAAMQQYGPFVQQALSEQLGYVVSDERVFAFMNPDVTTPELDEAYQLALMRGQPAQLGLGLRPEEEAQMLRQFGYSPEEAFRNYQGLAAELPQQQRMALVENYINAQSDAPDLGLSLEGTSYGQLFAAIQMKDANALEQIRLRMARAHAMWSSGGGAVRSGTSSVGLLTAGERAGI